MMFFIALHEFMIMNSYIISLSWIHWHEFRDEFIHMNFDIWFHHILHDSWSWIHIRIHIINSYKSSLSWIYIRHFMPVTYEFIYEFMYMKNIMKSYLISCVPRRQMVIDHELQKLAKPKYFCESIFAKACENAFCTCESRNLCEITICETSLAPPRLLARSWTLLLSLVILTVFTLFVIAILKPMVSACFSPWLPQMLHYPDMPTNLWRNTVIKLIQEHKIVCNLPDLSCSHVFFAFKSLSRHSRNDRVSASLIQWSLNVFSISSTLAKGGWKRRSLAIKRNLTDIRLIVQLSPPRLLLNGHSLRVAKPKWLGFYNFYNYLKLKLSFKKNASPFLFFFFGLCISLNQL